MRKILIMGIMLSNAYAGGYSISDLANSNSMATPFEILKSIYENAKPANASDFVTFEEMQDGAKPYRWLRATVIATTDRQDLKPGEYALVFPATIVNRTSAGPLFLV